MPANLFTIDNISYHIVRRTRKRNITITVNFDGTVTVSGPKWASDRDFAKAVEARRQWIQQHLATFEERRQTLPKRQFADGEVIPFLDGTLTIVRVQSNRKSIAAVLQGSHLVIQTPNTPVPDELTHIAMALQRLFIREGRQVFAERVAHFAAPLRVDAEKITVKNQKRRWGSCNPVRRSLNFNWRLMMAPLWVLDYVVVHELVHLIHANHSRAFWDTVAQAYPEWQAAKAWLHEHGSELTLSAPF